MAPPLKLTPEVQHRVCMLVRAGMPMEVAAGAAGVSASGVFARQRRDPRFRLALAQARADAEADDVAVLQRAARAGSWRAAAVLLERRFPERWAPPRSRR